MTDNDIAMIAELVQWNKKKGIPLKLLWESLEEIYGNDRNNISDAYYKRMKRGKYKNRGINRCTRTKEEDETRTNT